MENFTYASEPDQDGQVTIVEYGFDPETGRMRVMNAFQKTVKHFEVGGGSDGGGSDGGGSDGGGSDGGGSDGGGSDGGGSDGGGYGGGYGAGFDYDTSVSAPVDTDAALSGGDDLGGALGTTNVDGLVEGSFQGPSIVESSTLGPVSPTSTTFDYSPGALAGLAGGDYLSEATAGPPTGGIPTAEVVETQSAPPTAFGPTASMDFYSSLSDLGNVGRLAAYDTANALAGTGYGGLQQGTLGMTLEERAALESSLAREAMFEQNAKAFDTKDETKSGIGSFLSDPIAAIGGKIKDAIDNPVRSIVDLAFGQVPVIGQLNSISGLLGGPTVGGLVANPQQTLGLDISQSPYDLPGFDAYRDTTPAAMVAEEQGQIAGQGGYTQKDIAEMNNLVLETMNQEDQNNTATVVGDDKGSTVDTGVIGGGSTVDTGVTGGGSTVDTGVIGGGSTVDTGVVDVGGGTGGGTGGVDDTTGGGGKNDTIVGGGKNDTIVGEDKYSKYGIGVYKGAPATGTPYSALVPSKRKVAQFGPPPRATLPYIPPPPPPPPPNPFSPPPLYGNRPEPPPQLNIPYRRPPLPRYTTPSSPVQDGGIASLSDMQQRMAYPFPIQ